METSSSKRFAKILYVDALSAPNAKSNVEGIAAAYRKVGTLEVFDYRKAGETHRRMNERLRATALSFEPDLIHLGKCERVDAAVIADIKKSLPRCIVIHFYGDYRRSMYPSFVLQIARHADWLLLQHDDPDIRTQHLKLGARQVGSWFAGTNPAVHRPFKLPKVYDVVFIANNTHSFNPGYKHRRQLISALAKVGIQAHLFGNRWNQVAKQRNVTAHAYVSGEQFARACSQAKITLGYDTMPDIRLCSSWPRALNSMASGAFHLMRYVSGLETIFENRKHLVWFHSLEECVKLAGYYLAHPGERRRIAAAGRKEVLARHTWDCRITQMLDYASQTDANGYRGNNPQPSSLSQADA